jgi:poly(3-hydroxybutyrate) depolymerase
MLYRAYEMRRGLAAPAFRLARLQTQLLRSLPTRTADSLSVRALRAIPETVAALELTHRHPSFKIESVSVDGNDVPVDEDVIASTPFGTLLRFRKASDSNQPRILVVPAMAGHFATLIRGTLRALLPDHDVFVADWHNARDVPTDAGSFGLDEYIAHLIDFLDAIGPGAHLLAVCQPCAAAVAAASLMAEDEHPAQPASVILMAGPIDARVNPGRVNDFATKSSLSSLERKFVTTVPWPHKGAGRKVYPGFLQAMAFISLAPERHLSAFSRLAGDILRGSDAAATRTKEFYEEYFAVLDAAAEFYLDTARVIFKDHDLARGRLSWRGRRVNPAAISTALLTIEAENDELCPPGQTRAAHALCTGIPPERKEHHLQPGVGHYGVFSGTRFEREIYPIIREFVAANELLAVD